jgi:hypothetical protein
MMTEQEELRNDINRLIEVSGMRAMLVQNWNTMMLQMTALDQDQVMLEFLERLHEEFDPDELIRLVVPIYEKYYSHQEVLEMIKYHESPLGRKTVAMAPLIQQETAIAIQRLSQRKVAQSLGLPPPNWFFN